MLHGHSSAMFKCDFCCDVAVYRCFGTTCFCERCHREAGSNRYYPCPGAGECSNCIPHPRIVSEEGEGAVRSFVLGCAVCQGLQDAEPRYPVHFNAEGEFGYAPRRWEMFTGGDMLLAAVGGREVRYRLQWQHPSAPQDGEDVECAERLLLFERGVSCSLDLLEACGHDRLVLGRRLKAVNLAQGRTLLECADRLLLLRDAAIHTLGPEHFAPSLDDELPPLEDVDDSENALPPLESIGDAEDHQRILHDVCRLRSNSTKLCVVPAALVVLALATVGVNLALHCL